MKQQFFSNTPLPRFRAGEHANENSACCKFLMVENPFSIRGRVFSCIVAALRVYLGITRYMNNKKLSKSLDGPPFASSTKYTSTRDRIAGSDKAYFLFNKKNYYGFS
jgi:hypothetical protein